MGLKDILEKQKYVVFDGKVTEVKNSKVVVSCDHKGNDVSKYSGVNTVVDLSVAKKQRVNDFAKLVFEENGFLPVAVFNTRINEPLYNEINKQ